jgi:hypothetical protein
VRASPADPLMVVARNLGHADTRMVEKHYGHLEKSFIAEPMRAGAPRFEFADAGRSKTPASPDKKLKACDSLGKTKRPRPRRLKGPACNFWGAATRPALDPSAAKEAIACG